MQRDVEEVDEERDRERHDERDGEREAPGLGTAAVRDEAKHEPAGQREDRVGGDVAHERRDRTAPPPADAVDERGQRADEHAAGRARERNGEHDREERARDVEAAARDHDEGIAGDREAETQRDNRERVGTLKRLGGQRDHQCGDPGQRLSRQREGSQPPAHALLIDKNGRTCTAPERQRAARRQPLHVGFDGV